MVAVALLARPYLRREDLPGAEVYVLLMLSAAGGIVMASADDLIVLFLGLEILSIAVYVLAALHLRRIESQEGAMKYFVLGAFASAFLLYGMALVYGATGSTRLALVAEHLSTTVLVSDGMLLAIIVFMGVYPKPVIERMEPAVDALVAHVEAHVEGFTEPTSRFGADVEAGSGHGGGYDADGHSDGHGDVGGDDH